MELLAEKSEVYLPDIQSDYLYKYFDHDLLREKLDAAINVLGKYEFDSIAFRGLSGALFAPVLAFITKKTLIAVRKGESTHSGMHVEGDYAARRYIVVDDLVETGKTVRTIVSEIKRVMPTAEFVGMLTTSWSYGKEKLLLPDYYAFRPERDNE